MKFGVIGLGGIAQKAYLPTYSRSRDEAEFIFATRNPEVRKKIQDMYGFSSMVATLDDLFEEKIEACFIHVATKAHYELAKACLERGVHVFMDKPVSERVAEVKELQELASANHCNFMVGVNRRFAPMVDVIKQLSGKRLLQLQKNRVAMVQPTAFAIFDLFLHVVDTAVYLLEDDIHIADSQIIEQDGNIELAHLRLETPTTTAILSMDANSGANTEIFQASNREQTLMLRDLTELEVLTSSGKSLQTFSDWDTVLYRRGFEQMVESFIQACRTGDSSQLRQKNILLSHEICEEMLRRHLRHEI